jgi:N-acetylmuramoyl-L-alanine amidase
MTPLQKTGLILGTAYAATLGACSGGVVADTLFHECRGEPIEGQRAVASVIWNRAQVRNQSLEAVCLARKQFSCHNQGYRQAQPRNATERAILARFEAWEAVMLAGRWKPCGPWTHYFNPSLCNPAWAAGMSHRQRIGRHEFGKTK